MCGGAWRNSIYELFEYIPGQGYPQTLEATFESGRVLSLYHKLLQDFKSEWQPTGGTKTMVHVMLAGGKYDLDPLKTGQDVGALKEPAGSGVQPISPPWANSCRSC